MKMIAWNYRGCGNELIALHLLALVRKEKPDILFLSETKISAASMLPILNRLSFLNSHVISSCNKAGGMALAWNNSIQLDIISSCKYLIHINISLSQTNTLWKAFFFNGSSYPESRPHSWSLLSQISNTQVTPWLII